MNKSRHLCSASNEDSKIGWTIIQKPQQAGKSIDQVNVGSFIDNTLARVAKIGLHDSGMNSSSIFVSGREEHRTSFRSHDGDKTFNFKNKDYN